MTDHTLKINTYWFNEIINHNKYWEIRKNDRDYKPGDWLILYEHNISTLYTGRATAVEVVSVYNSDYLPSKDFVIMSIGQPEELAEEYIDNLNILLEYQSKQIIEAA